MDCLDQRIDKLKYRIKARCETQNMTLVDLLSRTDAELGEDLCIIRDTLSLIMYVEYILYGAK